MMSRTTDYFSGLADVYDANRPSYPIEAIDAALEGVGRGAVIIDVGCGTGISTRLLKSRGSESSTVIGIDPNHEMLTSARESSKSIGLDIEYRLGSAEATRLGAGSATVLIVAQAFHWFDPHQALSEFHRVLAPGGRLALIWNVRDDAHDEFTRAYSDIAQRSQADARAHGFETHTLRSADPTLGGWFTNAKLQSFSNPHRLSLDGLLGRARSASYFPRVGNPLRPVMEAELAALFDVWAHDGHVTLWHRTEVTTATRRE